MPEKSNTKIAILFVFLLFIESAHTCTIVEYSKIVCVGAVAFRLIIKLWWNYLR